MRHRRRLTTQTVQKKRPTGSYPKYNKPKKKSSAGKFFKIVFYLAFIAALGYAGYIYVLPHISLPTLESVQEQQPEPLVEFPVAEEVNQQPANQLTPIEKKIQIEVLNGCGEQGIAKILGDRLIRENYDIVNSGNYIENGRTNFSIEESRIIDQLKTTENLVRAKEMAKLVGIDNNLVESFENPSPIADITIIIGKDFKTLPVFKKD